MEEVYSPVVWNLPDDYLSYESFVKVCYGLDFRSSPGIPYVYSYPTIGDWFHRDGLLLDESRLQLLWADVQSLICGEFEIFLRLFIKREPHKASKIADKRWRLIMASPLCVQVLWNMLFHYQNNAEIDEVFQLPSKQGMSLVHGDWKYYYRQWSSKKFDFCMDAEAWDWTMPYWKLLWDLDFRFRMGRGGKMNEWFKLASYLYSMMFEHPMIALSDGTVYLQSTCGIMKSGCYNTISTNSHAQLFDHISGCIIENKNIFPLPDACGDDKFQNKKNALTTKTLNSLGVLVKIAFEGKEFIGHGFGPDGPYPLYLQKHLYSYCIEDPFFLGEFLESMLILYTHSPHFDFWFNLAIYHGVKTKSRFYYLNLYDNSEC